jgi:hypothetical protein
LKFPISSLLSAYVKPCFFSLIFEKLIKTTDIFDIKALTKGPDGACGDYVMLLAKNIDKEFKKIKLQTTAPDSSTISEFLYMKKKDSKQENPSQRDACRSLAIFYIRALQLVAAMTMSIYTPPELVLRIRNQTYDKTVKLQKKAPVLLTPEEKEEARKIRYQWFYSFFKQKFSLICSKIPSKVLKYGIKSAVRKMADLRSSLNDCLNVPGQFRTKKFCDKLRFVEIKLF